VIHSNEFRKTFSATTNGWEFTFEKLSIIVTRCKVWNIAPARRYYMHKIRFARKFIVVFINRL